MTDARTKEAQAKVIDEARAIHKRGWGEGTTYGLGEAFRELDEAERKERERTKPKKKRGSGGIGRRAGFKSQ